MLVDDTYTYSGYDANLKQSDKQTDYVCWNSQPVTVDNLKFTLPKSTSLTERTRIFTDKRQMCFQYLV